MQIYLPSDESQRELGTAIYKVSPMGVFAWKSYGLVKDKTVPFLPNSGYAFVVIHPAYSLLRSSWHGREAISVPVEKPRLSILNTYYREPAPERTAEHVSASHPCGTREGDGQRKPFNSGQPLCYTVNRGARTGQ